MAETHLSEVTSFRGASGEVVRGFISIGTLVTLFPVALVMLGLGLLAVLAMKLVDSVPLAVLITLLTTSPIVGRFALAAREGELNAGFFNVALEKGSVMGFVARHAVLVLMWGIPLTLLAAWMMKPGDEPSFAAATSVGTLLMVMVVLGILLQALSLLLATKADNVREAVSGAIWLWLWGRREDLAPFFAALVGGALILTAILWPLFGGLALAMASASPKLAFVLGIATYVAPGLAAPILFGRLCGAFVFGEEHMTSADACAPVRLGAVKKDAVVDTAFAVTPSPVPQSSKTPVTPMIDGIGGSPASSGSTLQAIRRIPIDQALGQLRMKVTSDPHAALNDAILLREAHPAHPIVAAELAWTYLRAGRTEEGIQAAVGAIKTALAAGTGPIAVELFQKFAPQRDAMTFDAATLESLGKVLLQRNLLEDSLWCFVAMSSMGGEPVKIQKGLIAVAAALEKTENRPRAIQVLDLLLSTYPDSTFRSYVEEQRNRLL